jgi:hypothetical protein
MAETALLEKIDNYLNGLLPDHEIDLLWEELIQNPDYIDYLETLKKLRGSGLGRRKPY